MTSLIYQFASVVYSFCSSDEPKGQEILTLKKESQTFRIGESDLEKFS